MWDCSVDSMVMKHQWYYPEQFFNDLWQFYFSNTKIIGCHISVESSIFYSSQSKLINQHVNVFLSLKRERDILIKITSLSTWSQFWRKQLWRMTKTRTGMTTTRKMERLNFKLNTALTMVSSFGILPKHLIFQPPMAIPWH